MTSIQDDEPDFDDYLDLPSCPHCMGSGEVPCHCGGDMCLCDYQGDATCYVCEGEGEGEVSKERYDRYMENQRKNAEAMRAIFSNPGGGLS